MLSLSLSLFLMAAGVGRHREWRRTEGAVVVVSLPDAGLQ